MKLIKLEVTLKGGETSALYLGAGNFCVRTEKVNSSEEAVVRIDTGIGALGGLLLHPSETYEKVTARIDQALRDAQMLEPPPYRGVKD